MDRRRGAGGLNPRLFLVAPALPADRLLACLKAAAGAGDVASLLVLEPVDPGLVAEAQAMGLAVLGRGAEHLSNRTGLDGVQVEATGVKAARLALGPKHIVGAYAGTSRHAAMEAAEAGADYVALDQAGATPGSEPIIGWWSALMEIPCVAFSPLALADLDIVLPQKPDFIRPFDAMWENPEAASTTVAAITKRLTPS